MKLFDDNGKLLPPAKRKDWFMRLAKDKDVGRTKEKDRLIGNGFDAVNTRVIGNLIILWPPCDECLKEYEMCHCGSEGDDGDSEGNGDY